MPIDYNSVIGRVAQVKKTLKDHQVAVGAWSVVIAHQKGAWQDGTLGITGQAVTATHAAGNMLKVVFLLTKDDALAESAFVEAGEPAHLKSASETRRNTSILKKVVQASSSQLGRMGIGDVEGERAPPAPTRPADNGLPGDSINVAWLEAY